MGLLGSLTISIQYLLLFSLSSSMLTNCLPSTHPTHRECHKYESHALLELNKSFVISKFASLSPSSYPKTLSWMPNTDCCSWDGIQCDELTGHVIGIDLRSSQLFGSLHANSTLFSLVHLQRLDLSDNDFNQSQIPAKIGEISQLKYLNLSQISKSTFSGSIPSQVSLLSNLLSLDLGSYIGSVPDEPFDQLLFKTSTLRSLIQNSTRLEELYLYYVIISSSVPDILTNLTDLKFLSLSNCGLNGEFPIGIFNIPNLMVLNLENNQNLSGMLPDFHSSSLISMLNLPHTSFYGTVPESIGNLDSLYWLSISNCKFRGPVPYSLGNLSQLAYLNLEFNSFTDEIPHSLFQLVNLKNLLLGNNLLQGHLNLDMFLKLKMLSLLDLSYNKLSFSSRKSSPTNVTLPSLEKLDLDSCNLSGEFPSWIMNLTSLSYLSLRENNLRGEIPPSLFRLENLKSLSLQDNSLEGHLDLSLFVNLKYLTFLGLSHNKLSLFAGNVSSNATLSPIGVLDLISCNMTEFPRFFQDLEELSYLDMSYNELKSLPSWMWKKENLQSFSVSHSFLTGELSPFICNLKKLVNVDLSYNNLSGIIPSCLGNLSQSLQALNLKGNKLIGQIPKTYMIGCALEMVDFSENNLQGQLPRDLVNCGMLEFLDVSHNNISGPFPFWLGTLPELKVVALGHNEFYGAIMCPNGCNFHKLHILDLSHNNFSGSLPPKIIKTWKSMTLCNMSQLKYEDNTIHFKEENSCYSYTRYAFTMFNKGVVLDYNELQHFYEMVAIDISSNKFSGNIPDVIGDLKCLILLNLSNNTFNGSIPSSFKKLSNLEALDLSLNNLSGMIPPELTELTFLAFFNVSFNNLYGPIPENKQFSTFEESSFEGNQGLCGIQLHKRCEDQPPSLASDGDQDSNSGSFFEYYWEVVMIGYGGGLVAGVALGSAFWLDFLTWMKRVFTQKLSLWTLMIFISPCLL